MYHFCFSWEIVFPLPPYAADHRRFSAPSVLSQAKTSFLGKILVALSWLGKYRTLS